MAKCACAPDCGATVNPAGGRRYADGHRQRAYRRRLAEREAAGDAVDRFYAVLPRSRPATRSPRRPARPDRIPASA